MTHRFRLLLRARTSNLDQAFTTSRHYRKKWNHPAGNASVTPNLSDREWNLTQWNAQIDGSLRRDASRDFRREIEHQRNATWHPINYYRSFLTNVLAWFNSSYVTRDPLCTTPAIWFPTALRIQEHSLLQKKSYKICLQDLSTVFYNIYFICLYIHKWYIFASYSICEINRFVQFLFRSQLIIYILFQINETEMCLRQRIFSAQLCMTFFSSSQVRL